MMRVQRVIGDINMLSWLAIPFHAMRLGMEAQNAVASSFLSLVGSTPQCRAGENDYRQDDGRAGSSSRRRKGCAKQCQNSRGR